MLAFDDAALAQLVIAAGRVPPEQRGRWLRGLAKRIEKDSPNSHSKKSRAVIQSDYRKRKRAGLMLLDVLVDEVAVPEALVQAGLLSPDQTDDSEAVAAAVAQMLSTIVNESLARYR